MRIAVAKETREGERRVALVPEAIPALISTGCDVWVETNAGAGASYANTAYEKAGATIITDDLALWEQADVVVKVGPLTEPADLYTIDRLRPGAVLIGFLNPLGHGEVMQRLAAREITGLSMERIPRLSRAQSMDTLSSQATVAGYKAALLAANAFGKFFPMLTTVHHVIHDGVLHLDFSDEITQGACVTHAGTILRTPLTAPQGNLLAAVGMLVAVVATLLDRAVLHAELIVLGLFIGALIGTVAARWVRMTAMPEMVGLLNGFGGGASALVAVGEYWRLSGMSASLAGETTMSILLGVSIGSVTLTGSLAAFGKLQGMVPGRPLTFPLNSLCICSCCLP
jgi:hypothetical protein